jgi:DtxR family Mn-dependent transcriptional regulator
MNHNTTVQEYIEVIHALEEKNRVARVKDIADRRGVTRSSVSLELNRLMEKELIAHEQYGHVVLTDSGRRLALSLRRRHRAIKNFLVKILDISEDHAEQDACKLEHIVSEETLSSLIRFLTFVDKCPKDWKRMIRYYRGCQKYGQGEIKCSECPESR